MKTWETICNIEKNNKLDIIFSRKEPSLVDDALLALLSSLFLSRGRLQALPSVLACVHSPTYPLVFVPRTLPLCFFVRYTSSFVMHPGSGLCFSRSKAQPHHPPVDGRSSILAAESSLHTGCTEYTPAFDYSAICLRARTESPNMPAFEALTCTALTGGVRA